MERVAIEDRISRAAWTALGCSLLLLNGCGGVDPRVAPGTSQALLTRSVCPQHQPVWIPASEDTAWRQVASLTVPGAITQIPEFHDCQRLLTQGESGYGPTAAIYASPIIVTLVDTLLALEQAGDSLRAIAAAEIISDGAYQQLGIEMGVNCLYMYTFAAQLHAFMRPVSQESDCAQRLDPTPPQPGWRSLNVKQETAGAPFVLEDFPPAARWDFHDQPGPRLQFIGLPCKTNWCLIGHANPQSWKQYDRPQPGNHGRLSRRVMRIRGWYDEQILGVGPTTGTGPVVPGGVYGTIFPDSLLEGRTEADYQLPAPNQWVAAAEILVHGNLPAYKKKFNLDQTPPPTNGVAVSNKLALCKGDATRCVPHGAPNVRQCPSTMPDPWYARITAVGGDVAYSCVIRHLHPGFRIPGNARWWWLPQDEGIWSRCPQGCCQVT